MAGVKANISFSIDATASGTSDLGDPKQRVTVSEELDFIAGTDAVNKANILFADTRTLAASATENLDFAGTLANAFGQTIAAAEILAIFIRAADGNTNSVRFGPASSNGFTGPFADATDRLNVKPGEYIGLVSETGWPVTAGTGDLLTVLNSAGGTPVTYDVVVLGRTVAA